MRIIITRMRDTSCCRILDILSPYAGGPSIDQEGDPHGERAWSMCSPSIYNRRQVRAVYPNS